MRLVRLHNQFSDETYLVLNASESQLKKLIFKVQPDYKQWMNDSTAVAARMESPIDKEKIQHFYIWINSSESKSQQRLDVMHEALHCVFSLAESSGAPVGNGHKGNQKECLSEWVCYLHQSLVEQIFKILRLE